MTPDTPEQSPESGEPAAAPARGYAAFQKVQDRIRGRVSEDDEEILGSEEHEPVGTPPPADSTGTPGEHPQPLEAQEGTDELTPDEDAEPEPAATGEEEAPTQERDGELDRPEGRKSDDEHEPPTDDDEKESEEKEPPEADRPDAEAAEEAPAEVAQEAAEPDADDHPVLVTVTKDKRFTREDVREALEDDEKWEELQTELNRGYMREDRFTQLRQEDKEQFRQRLTTALDAVESQAELLQNLYTNESTRKILTEFGESTDVLQRFLSNPARTRQILADRTGEQAERIYARLVEEEERPELRQARLEQERLMRENAQHETVRAQHTATQTLANAMLAIQDQIDSIASEYPDVDSEEVVDFVLELGDMTRDDWTDLSQATPGMRRIVSMMVTPEGRIRENLLKREFQRLSVTSPKKQTKEDRKAAEHDEEVDQQLSEESDAPPPPPGGGTPPTAKDEKGKKAESPADIRARYRRESARDAENTASYI